jgi:hypothetical protein
MKLRTYTGDLKNRKDLEDILQEHLPTKAKVFFAMKKCKLIPMEYANLNAQQDNVLAFWEFNRMFFSAYGMRRWIPDEQTGAMETSGWMFPSETRIHPKQFLSDISSERFKWPEGWLGMQDALREMLAKMIEMEKAWGIEPETAEQVLASERFAPRRN